MIAEKLTRLQQPDQPRSYVGTCNDMCPERERLLRFGNRMPIFERNIETNEPEEFAMVKEYRRAGADQEEPLSHDLRTPQALQLTMDYLVCNIMDDPRSRQPDLAIEWYDYLWDRLRAIRKDITQQNICDLQSAKLVECCTRFHIHTCYAMSHIKDFDVGMNRRNLNDCLQMLRQMYKDIRASSTVVCPGELDFLKYDILLHLDEDYLSTNVHLKTSDYRSTKEMKFITRLFQAYTCNDYYNFLKLMKEADYMTSCILSLFVNKVRLAGLKITLAACPAKQVVLYPAELMIDILAFDGIEDLKAFVEPFGITLSKKGSQTSVALRKDLINSIRQSSTIVPIKSKVLVEDKMKGLSVGQLVYGQQQIKAIIQPKPQPSLIGSSLNVPASNLNQSRSDLSSEQFAPLHDQNSMPGGGMSQDSLQVTLNSNLYQVQPVKLSPALPRYEQKISSDDNLQQQQQSIPPQPNIPPATTTPPSQLCQDHGPPQSTPSQQMQQILHPITPDNHPEIEIDEPPIRKRPKRSLEELADFMPAGRMRVYQPGPQAAPQATSVASCSTKTPSPKKKPIEQEFKIDYLNSSIAEEKKANDSLFKLIRLLI